MMHLGPTTNVANQHLSNVFSINGQHAMLILLSPKSVIDTCKRPHLYDFNQNLVNDIGEQIKKSLDQTIGMNFYNPSFMRQYASTAGAIMPDSSGIYLKTSIFGDSWTFMLIVDNEQLNTRGMYTGPKLSNRLLYSGYCIGEPCSDNGLGGGVSLNPSCILKITHHSGINVERQFASSGEHCGIGRLMTDVDVVPPDIMQHLSNQNEFLLRPQDIRESTTANFDNTIAVADYKSLQMHGNRGVPIQSVLNSPRHHLQSIVFGATRTFDNLTNDDYTSSLSGNGASSLIYPTSDIYNATFDECIAVQPADMCLSLDISLAYSIADLNTRYPNLQVKVNKAPKLSTNDLANQMEATRSNLASSVINSTLPMLMVNTVLSEFAFFYTSYSGNMVMGGEDPGIFKIENVATFMPEHPKHIKQRVSSIISQLKTDVFPMIKYIGGDFDVSCSINSAGEANTLLFYKDEIQNATGIYETPLLVGGINSPLVGSKSVLENNAASLNALLNQLSTGSTTQSLNMEFNDFDINNHNNQIDMGFNLPY